MHQWGPQNKRDGPRRCASVGISEGPVIPNLARALLEAIENSVCGRAARDRPIAPLQNLSRSLADLVEMRIATLPRIALEEEGGPSPSRGGVCPSAEEDPCPCSAALHDPDDDHSSASPLASPRPACPVLSDGAAFASEQLDTQYNAPCYKHLHPSQSSSSTPCAMRPSRNS